MRRARALDPLRADDLGSEYQVVSLLPSWGALSLTAAVFAVLSRPILGRVLFDWLAWRPRDPWSWPIAVAAASLLAGLLGLLAGVAGLRSRRGSRTLAGIGVVANATVVVLLLLMNVLFVYIRLR